MAIDKNTFKQRLKKAAQKVQSRTQKGSKIALHELKAGAQKLADKRIVIGVTGLSQSGKSTFITSFINQLLNYEHAALSGFDVVREGRLLWSRLHPLNDELQQYPYDESYQALAGEQPVWPESTKDASGCLVELRIKPRKSAFDMILPSEYSFFIEIRDYPGEWLLDLPMMSMSYSRWCAQCNAQFTKPPRSDIFAELMDSLQQIDPMAETDDDILEQLFQAFTEKLKVCKNSKNSLSLIQPGRFLIPGQQPIPKFIPLLDCGRYTEGQLVNADKNSWFKVCEAAYNQYVNQLIKPFYKLFFSKLDRQVVLVDVINTLNAGPEYLTDMRQAISNIIDSFHYGEQNKLKQLFVPKIDKVIYSATKVDQVVAQEHEAVTGLLQGIVKQAVQYAQFKGVKPDVEAVAAVRASSEQLYKKQPSIIGSSLDGEAIGYVHPKIPNRIPNEQEWQTLLSWQLPYLNPPKGLSKEHEDAIPHIRMDKVLQTLLGDKCQ